MRISDSLLQVIAAHLNSADGWDSFIKNYKGDHQSPAYLNLLKLRNKEIDLSSIANTRGNLQED